MCCRCVSIPSCYQTKPFRCLPASAVEQRGEGLDAAQIPLVAAQPRIRERVRRQGSSVHRWSVWSLGPLRNWSDNLLGLYKKLRSLFPCGILFHALFLQCQHMWSSFPCTLLVVFLLAASLSRGSVRLLWLSSGSLETFYFSFLWGQKVHFLCPNPASVHNLGFPVGGVRLLEFRLQNLRIWGFLPVFPKREGEKLFGGITGNKFSPVLSFMF